MGESPHEVTQLLQAWSEGEQGALDKLAPVVYRELHRLAQRYMAQKLMAVQVQTHPVFQSGYPRALYLTDLVDTGIRTGPMSWDVAADGRFLFITESSIDASVTVVLNWRAGLNKLGSASGDSR